MARESRSSPVPVGESDERQYAHGRVAYYDAADQAGQSHISGCIHILADDFGGRVMGATIGTDAYERAETYFTGTAVR